MHPFCSTSFLLISSTRFVLILLMLRCVSNRTTVCESRGGDIHRRSSSRTNAAMHYCHMQTGNTSDFCNKLTLSPYLSFRSHLAREAEPLAIYNGVLPPILTAFSCSLLSYLTGMGTMGLVASPSFLIGVPIAVTLAGMPYEHISLK